jgi:hypothetical protein
MYTNTTLACRKRLTLPISPSMVTRSDYEPNTFNTQTFDTLKAKAISSMKKQLPLLVRWMLS